MDLGGQVQVCGPRQGIAVVQLCTHEHVLVYHYCKAKRPCPALTDLLWHKAITFASVDIRNDKSILSNQWIKIPQEHHVDIQKQFLIKGGEKRDSMGDLTTTIIDHSYDDMKTAFLKILQSF